MKAPWPEAGEPGVADQQHQADAGDRQDEHLRELADVELRAARSGASSRHAASTPYQKI